MDLVCLMGLIPKEYEAEIQKNSFGNNQVAANNFQWALVNGFSQLDECNMKIINSLFIGAYPKHYKKKEIPTFKFQYPRSEENINIGFKNIPVYRMFSKYKGIKREIDKWANNGSKDNKVIIAYAMTSPFVEILYYIKKEYPNIITCLIVPDLPEYMNVAASNSRLYRILKNIQIKHFKKKLKKINGYVFLTKYMKEWFKDTVKYTIVEGISNSEYGHLDNEYNEKRKSILYAGMLEEKYGIIELVESFMKLKNPEWTLELYGNGTCVERIKNYAQQDTRIHYNGTVSNKTIREKQKQSELLINPRRDRFEFTKYSFPSKTIEYMESGTPMIGYKLSGMPEEYIDYFYVIPLEKDGLYKTLKYVTDLDSESRRVLGEKAYKFVIENKDSVTQCKKIIEFLNSLIEKK